ncbi:hypothetical protein [Iningainema tapete]|uniref:hypothetical protein n=1 Tax=Iningainema tapete TaxID=2806730 RepID=UPI00192D485C|nr:hypothetical protein [Iningainema tapete]
MKFAGIFQDDPDFMEIMKEIRAPERFGRYMTWILDTDHASLFLAGNKSIITAVAKYSTDVAITVITVQELFNGWVGRLNNPVQAKNLTQIYTKLWETTEFIKVITVLNIDLETPVFSSKRQKLLQFIP